MENKNVDISIVIPVYGSENVLEELTSQIKLAAAKDQIFFGNYEIIFVCDNSPDHSWDVINQIALNNANVLGLLLRINAGQHNAIAVHDDAPVGHDGHNGGTVAFRLGAQVIVPEDLQIHQAGKQQKEAHQHQHADHEHPGPEARQIRLDVA